MLRNWKRVYGKLRNPEADNKIPKRTVADTQNRPMDNIHRLMERVRTHPKLYIPFVDLTIFTDCEILWVCKVFVPIGQFNKNL